MQQDRLSDQIRRAIEGSGISQPRICELIELDRAAMHRFMRGEAGLSMDVLDRIADLLNLEISVNQKRKGRSKMMTATDPRSFRLRFVNNQFDDLVNIPVEGVTKAGEAAHRAKELPPGSTLSHYTINVLKQPATTAMRRHIQASTPDWVYVKFGLTRP